MRLIYIRHGESTHFNGNIVAGRRGCPGLTQRGVDQAQALADFLKQTGRLGSAPLLLHSPFPRARQTGQIVAQTLGLPMVEEPDLAEVNPGEADGMTRTEYEARYGKFHLQDEPQRPYAPGGENWEQFIARVARTPGKLAALYPDQTVVAFTHAGFIVISFLLMFGLPFVASDGPHNRARIDPDFASMTEWQWLPESNHWRLVSYNVTAP